MNKTKGQSRGAAGSGSVSFIQRGCVNGKLGWKLTGLLMDCCGEAIFEVAVAFLRPARS